MSGAKFSIGIDLGTTNCAMAFEPLEGDRRQSEVFAVAQWETLGTLAEAPTLPSFLYLPAEHEAEQLRGKRVGAGEWIPGRFARKQAAESPGRVIHSAKSWLCHHAVDRSAAFLPWRSDELPIEKRISPIQASALLLKYLRGAWNARFAREGADFDRQDVTITVPASFDAVAQGLTLEAAQQAGFPSSVRLLEEPQAAFYRWLEQHTDPRELWKVLPDHGRAQSYYVLVIDIGGGTTDLSLFELSEGSGTSLPHIKRAAVSDHLLLGGDNIDLAIAHRLEQRFRRDGLPPSQWNFLVAHCRDLKERCLAGLPGDLFSVSIPGRGSGLLGGTLSAQIEREEIESIVLDGFFPVCNADDLPARTQAGLREWALPYAADSAITRYLADFLRDRPQVDAVLFNGGLLYPESLRRRLQEQIARFQHGRVPAILENPEPDLAVARGAARYGSILRRRAQRIEAGAARAVYLEVHRRPTRAGEKATLVCILPRGAESDEEFRIANLGLELRVNRPVRFQPYYSTRHASDKAGSLVTWNEKDFHRLPPLETTARMTHRRPDGERLPITLSARMNELGLLQVACVSADPRVKQSWPLEFNLRPHESGNAGEASAGSGTGQAESAGTGVDDPTMAAARNRITSLFSRPLDRRDRLTATNLLKSLEQILKMPKAEWNGALIRALWPALYACFDRRKENVEHEEAWLIVAGFLLRPGFGARGDEARIDELWRLHREGLAFPGKRIQLQQYILWRRVAGGLSVERQEAVLAPEMARLRSEKSPPAELIRLAGSLERLSQTTKAELIDVFLERACYLAGSKSYCAPYLVALGLLLNRAPLYTGPETVVSPDSVKRVYEALSTLDWTEPDLAEIQTLFLRAARIVDHRSLDLPRSLRESIASKLESSGVAPLKVERLRSFVPLQSAERAGLLGEALPPGLVLGGE